MHTIISNKITIKDASQEVWFWVQDNLVLTNPTYETLKRLGKENTIRFKHISPKLNLFVEKGFDLVVPFGCLKALWPMIQKGTYETKFNDHGIVMNKNENITLPLYDYQEKVVQGMLKAKSGILIGGCGSGKGLPLDTLIATPTGWIKNGDLKIGDYVLGKNGKPTKVVGIFDRGLQPCYKVIFNDKNEVICDSSHLWNIQYNDDRLLGNGKFRTKDTETLFYTLHKKRDNDGFIPMIEPVEYEEKDVPINPWVLGVLLGDGSFSLKQNIQFCNSEKDLIEKMSDILGTDNINVCKNSGKTASNIIIRNTNTKIKEKIKDLGLMGKHSYEKFIPNVYKYNSIDVRWKVIQGLFDTDGYVDTRKNGSFEYSTTSKQLALDFKEIIESLGGICYLRERQTKYTYKGIKKNGRISYRLTFFINNKMLPFTTKKHSKNWKERKTYRTAYRVIRKIEKVEPQVTRCIQVDAPDSLYAIQNFIITHNTQCGIEIAHRIGRKTLWLTHTSDLLNQSLNRAKMLYPGLEVGTITDGKVNIGRDMTFATVQTMSTLDPDVYKDEFDVVIVDECHHISGAPTLMKQFMSVIEKIPARYKFGITASETRNDSLTKCMYAATSVNDSGEFKPIEKIAREDIKVMEAKHVKVDLDTPMFFENEFGEIVYPFLAEDGTFDFMKLVDYLSKDKTRNGKIIEKILEHKDRKQIVLCSRKEQCELINSALLEKGIRSVLLMGNVTKKKRKEILENVSGWDVIICTVSLAKEGLDVPELSVLHLCSPISNKSDTVQCAGRVERVAPNKPEPIVLDYVDINLPYCVNRYNKRAGWLKRRY